MVKVFIWRLGGMPVILKWEERGLIGMLTTWEKVEGRSGVMKQLMEELMPSVGSTMNESLLT